MIDFSGFEEKTVNGFRGGEGPVKVIMFRDDNIAIAQLTIPAGSYIGRHIHETDSEVIRVVKGTLHFTLDEGNETLTAGDVHYCPMGHSHSVKNNTDEDAIIFAVIPKHPVK